jgi:DNA-directed RNA polymerase specialized sigma24 family protein
MAAIQQLPDKYRLPLVMHAVGELPYEEIARSLELPLATVKGPHSPRAAATE